MRGPKRLRAVVLAALLATNYAAASPAELNVELDPQNREWMRRGQSIRLQMSRQPFPEEGRLAILLDKTDLTDLFVTYDDILEYRPAPVPLRPGEYDITVFLVSPQGGWHEIARLPVRVLTDAGLEHRAFESRVDLQGIRLLDESTTPEDSAPSNSPDAASLNLHLGADARRAGWRLAGAMQALGVGEQANALRFSQRGADAPRFDLSNYSVRLDRAEDARAYLALGHVAYNQHRHLIPAFTSRGTIAGMPLGRAGSATFAAMNGTSIVGWNNITGLADSDHRVTATSIGFELRPARPGALRVDADYLDGSLLPLNPFNSGGIGDRQTSRGWGLRFLGSTPSGRLRFESGFARSAFDNPFDPSLAQGLTLTAVEREERDARYADVNWDFLRGKTFGKNRLANLSLSLRHERIDPQYATVAASLQADVLRNAALLGGTVGPLQMQLGYTRLEDNLDRIPSILTTHTRRGDAMLALPLAELLRPGESVTWLPVASWNFNHVHQSGAGVPPDSGFNASHVPDQLSERRSLALDWRGMRWSIGVRHDDALQDNRQPGRERADFETRVDALNSTFTPHPRLHLNLELSRERNFSLEQGSVTRTRNVGFGFRLAATDKLQLSATAGLTRSADQPRTQDSENTFLDASLSYQFEWKRPGGRGLSGQLFLRYADRAQMARNALFGFDLDNRARTVVAGLNFGLR